MNSLKSTLNVWGKCGSVYVCVFGVLCEFSPLLLSSIIQFINFLDNIFQSNLQWIQGIFFL